jgi:hypothetical protein
MNPRTAEMSPPTQEERDAISACLSVLPAELRTPTVASVLLVALRNEEARQLLWANPGQVLSRAGVKIGANTRIVAHDPQKDGVVLILPRLGTMAPTTVGTGTEAKVELADSDLRSGGSRTVDFGPLRRDWDNWTADNDVPTQADNKAGDQSDGNKDMVPDNDKSNPRDRSFD